jgi:predicted RNA polymerase sigma factor
VALNRAVAVGMAQGPAAGLAAVEAITADGDDAGMARHHLFHSVRGDLLTKLGNFSAARAATERAIALTQNVRERELLAERLKRLDT